MDTPTTKKIERIEGSGRGAEGPCNNPLLAAVADCGVGLRAGGIPPIGTWAETRRAVAGRVAKAMRLEGAETGSDGLSEDAATAYEAFEDMCDRYDGLPAVWTRRLIASSLMDEEGYRLLAAHGGGQVWDVGAGSGYHAAVLSGMGCRVHASDRPENRFPVRFFGVADEPDRAEVAAIAAAGGTALYFWPWREYPGLDLWVECGGTRVATVGCFELHDHCWCQDHPETPVEAAPRLCVPFEREGFRLVGTHRPPHYSATDPSVQDVMQLWEREARAPAS